MVIKVPLCHCASVPCPRQNNDCKAGPCTLWASLRVACEERETFNCLCAVITLCLSSEKTVRISKCIGPTMHSAKDTIKSWCLCAIVPLCHGARTHSFASLHLGSSEYYTESTVSFNNTWSLADNTLISNVDLGSACSSQKHEQRHS